MISPRLVHTSALLILQLDGYTFTFTGCTAWITCTGLLDSHHTHCTSHCTPQLKFSWSPGCLWGHRYSACPLPAREGHRQFDYRTVYSTFLYSAPHVDYTRWSLHWTAVSYTGTWTGGFRSGHCTAPFSHWTSLRWSTAPQILCTLLMILDLHRSLRFSALPRRPLHASDYTCVRLFTLALLCTALHRCTRFTHLSPLHSLHHSCRLESARFTTFSGSPALSPLHSFLHYTAPAFHLFPTTTHARCTAARTTVYLHFTDSLHRCSVGLITLHTPALRIDGRTSHSSSFRRTPGFIVILPRFSRLVPDLPPPLHLDAHCTSARSRWIPHVGSVISTGWVYLFTFLTARTTPLQFCTCTTFCAHFTPPPLFGFTALDTVVSCTTHLLPRSLHRFCTHSSAPGILTFCTPDSALGPRLCAAMPALPASFDFTKFFPHLHLTLTLHSFCTGGLLHRMPRNCTCCTTHVTCTFSSLFSVHTPSHSHALFPLTLHAPARRFTFRCLRSLLLPLHLLRLRLSSPVTTTRSCVTRRFLTQMEGSLHCLCCGSAPALGSPPAPFRTHYRCTTLFLLDWLPCTLPPRTYTHWISAWMHPAQACPG